MCALLPNFAWADSCPRANSPSVKVVTRQDQPRLDLSLNIDGLKGMRNSRDTAGGGSDHVPLGLAAAKVTFQINMQAMVTPMPDGSMCADLTDVTIEFAFADTAIYIANEIPQGSCIYAEVLTHERRHVAVDGQLLQEWKYRLQQDSEYAVRMTGSVRGRDKDEIIKEIQDRIRAKLDTTNDALIAERGRRQAQVDTRMEYDRVSRSCHGEAQDIVRKALGYQ